MSLKLRPAELISAKMNALRDAEEPVHKGRRRQWLIYFT